MFTICKGNQNIVQDTLTDKAAKVRNLLLEADAIIIGAGAGLSTAAGIEYAGLRFRAAYGLTRDRNLVISKRPLRRRSSRGY